METGAAEFAGPFTCSPNAEARRKTIAKKVSVEGSEGSFILFVDFLTGWIN
jgi:hypothetical protein